MEFVRVAKTGEGIPGRGNGMSKGAKQETAGSVRETANNSI